MKRHSREKSRRITRRSGFTMIEVLVALVIGAILMGIAITAVGPAIDKNGIRAARGAFTSLHAVTRAHAIERSARTDLHVDFAGDSIWISSGGEIIESRDFKREYNVDLQGGSGVLRLCMTPRGFAESSCNSFSTSATIRFVRNAQQTEVTILPLGQVVF